MPFYSCLLSMLLYSFISCTDNIKSFETDPAVTLKTTRANNIRGISLPAGFKYVDEGDPIFTNWLLDLNLRSDSIVYLYNGLPRSNQEVQYGVLDINIGKKDLVQCADAAIKLRADYLYKQQRYDQLKFIATSGDTISFDKWLKGTRWRERSGRLIPRMIQPPSGNLLKEYDSFMEIVFAYCGTYSISKQLRTITDIRSIRAGDVFVEGGFPGHAVTVMAVAANGNGKKIFLLSQGYMPAQDIHILKNYSDPVLSPWYDLSEIYPLPTPQWQFGTGSLRRW